MTSKPNLQMGHVTPASGEFKVSIETGASVIHPPFDREKQRAEAWKAMAERLYKSAICDCTEGTGTVCTRCLKTIRDFHNLKADEAKSRPG